MTGRRRPMMGRMGSMMGKSLEMLPGRFKVNTFAEGVLLAVPDLNPEQLDF